MSIVIKIRDRRYGHLGSMLAAADYIAHIQRRDGEIPWSRWGRTDPWDHVESAMGLTVGGYRSRARKAYLWCADKQLPDGSWWSCYRRGKPRRGAYKDSNMTAYLATGVFHYYLATGDKAFVYTMWPVVDKAMAYVEGLQAGTGQIYWAQKADGTTDTKALLAGSCSIYFSIGCAIRIAHLVGEQRPNWLHMRRRLQKAIVEYEELFDVSTRRYAMDWYYPVLCGALRDKAAHERIEGQWGQFVIPGIGVRCVCDRPWLTIAETSELVITLAAMGRMEQAREVLGWIKNTRYRNGAYWTGFTLPDCRIYTKEKTTWTAASTLLAADIVYEITPASELFSHSFWEGILDTAIDVETPRQVSHDEPMATAAL